MLDLKQIESFYPPPLRVFKRNLLREYLQYKILEIIFESKFANDLAFMGGTAIHILHGNPRFSEDLDFDNRGLKKEDFKRLTELVLKKLSNQGYNVSCRSTFHAAYRSAVRFEDIFFKNNLSPHAGEKMLIQLDMEPQRYDYLQEPSILNKFDVFLRIHAVPVDILLAQKIYAIFNRRRALGRDFFDAVFLFSKTRPHGGYLKAKLRIDNSADLKERLLARCRALNFKQLARDVEAFLFSPEDVKKVLYFQEFVEQYPF